MARHSIPRPRSLAGLPLGAARVVAGVVALALVAGCASQGAFRPSAENSSGDSKSESNDSSKGSGDSSDKSGDSSQDGGSSGSKDGGSSGTKDGKSESHSDSSKNDESSKNSSVTVAVAGGVLLLVGIVILVVVLNNRARRDDARAYLETRRRPIRVSLARGSGLFVDDVATALELPADRVPVLGQAIHAHRAALDRWLADPQISDDDLHGFTTELRTALAGEPSLTPYITASRERLGALFGP